MKLIIHAPNIHQGGGLSLFRELLLVLSDDTRLILDSRLPISDEALSRHRVLRVRPTLLQRLKAERYLQRITNQDDKVLCFSNLPPLFKLRGETTVFLQNRLLIDSVGLSSFSWKVYLRLQMERMLLSLSQMHADHFVVQTQTMQRLLKRHLNVSARILPFAAEKKPHLENNSKQNGARKDYDFLYVASGDPHKNHRNLVHAWVLLAEQNIHPSLHLTVDMSLYPDLCSWIERICCDSNLNIHNHGNVSSEQIHEMYGQSQALIYPSTLESFGLPLLEGCSYELPVIAPELDYVRDVIDPVQTFDPSSPVSIARAVRRFLNATEETVPLLNAKSFFQLLFKS